MRIQLFLFIIGLFFITFFSSLKEAIACESCTIPNLGRNQGVTVSESKDKKWFFKYLYEQQVLDEISADEAHELHEDGHDVHDKKREEFHHFILGAHVTDQLTIHGDIPYVLRESIEIEDHDRLGAQEESKGLGDLTLIGDYRIFQDDNRSFGLVGGVKLPTGATDELNSVGTMFEPELQPGTGSADYILGSIYEQTFNRVKLFGNLAYVFKTEGDHDALAGNLLSTSFFVDYLLNPESEYFKTEVGIHSNLQYEQKHEEDGVTIEDSGGTTIFLGPSVSIATNQNVSVFGSVLMPVYQKLGGEHQEMVYSWTLGGTLSW